MLYKSKKRVVLVGISIEKAFTLALLYLKAFAYSEEFIRDYFDIIVAEFTTFLPNEDLV